jgi:hypothetical protein
MANSVVAFTALPLERTSPATRAVAITPANSNLAAPVKRLYIGGAGNVSVRPIGQTTDIVFTGMLVGTYLDVSCIRVNSTGTTATNIVGLL